MVTTFTVVGVAGAGKTAQGMSILERKLRDGLKWHQIGYSSFSRAACMEASERAAKITGVDVGRLQKDGFFRTIHSSALRMLGLSAKLLIDPESSEGKKWITEVLGAPRGGEAGTLSAKIDEALTWWDVSRSRLNRMRLKQPDLPSLSERVPPIPPDPTQIPPVVGPKKPSVLQEIPSISDRNTTSVYRAGFENRNLKRFHTEDSESGGIGGIGDIKNPLYSIEHWEKRDPTTQGFRWDRWDPNHVNPYGQTTKVGPTTSESPSGTPPNHKHNRIVKDYEDAKRHSGRFDFTDILLKYAGIEIDSELMLTDGYPHGSVPEEVQVWIVDEYQDCSALLDRVAQRLSENAQELWLLGDPYQAVYGFSGSDSRLFAHRDREAKQAGNSLLLNRTWRNPETVVEWGEEVLREYSGYEERSPISEAGQGSVGMIDIKGLMDGLGELAKKDTMILARAWFALRKVKDRLDELAIPWRSCQEKQSSRWECPVKIAFVLTMRALMAGERISAQDWRRVTKELPQKMDGVELFTRGTKANWAKMECSGENVMTIRGLSEWGAAEGFTSFVLQERWRRDIALLLDIAIEKYGIDVVRKPRIQIGSCHSVKGLGAANVFCLATSSKKSAESDPFEELCLRYVTITRASKNFRVVVDLYEHAQGKPLFLPCPRGYWTFEGIPEDLGDDGKQDSERFSETGEQDAAGVGSEDAWGNVRKDRRAGRAD